MITLAFENLYLNWNIATIVCGGDWVWVWKGEREIEPRALCELGKGSTIKLHLQLLLAFFPL